MCSDYKAILEREGGWFFAYSPDHPGANGLGRTRAECLQSLSDAIRLVSEDVDDVASPKRSPEGAGEGTVLVQ